MIYLRSGKPESRIQGYVHHTAYIDAPTEIEDIWFMLPADTHPVADDWLVPIGTLIGMATGEDVHIAGQVSQQLLASMEEIQRILLLRHEGLKPVRISADTVAPTPQPETRRSIACFSNGVDAFYTALAEDAQPDELLYVQGFESRVDNERLLALLLPELRKAAAELEKPLILAETNWCDVIESLTAISFFSYMPMLISIAHLMGSRFTQLVVPSTFDPFFDLNDPSSVPSYLALWGTEALEAVEHGHVSRFEKVCRLTESDIAMRYLRVCGDATQPKYNCCQCRKCQRTRLHLKLANAEGRCKTLPPILPLQEIKRGRPERPEHRNYLEENIAEAESQGRTELAAILGAKLDALASNKSKYRNPVKVVVRFVNRLFVRWLYRGYRNRRFDASVQRLKRVSGADHFFNIPDTDFPESGK